MTSYIFRRLLSATPTLLGVTLAVFMFVHVLPGDPARLMAGIQATEESVQMVRQSLGLDKPLWVQYGIYFNDLIHGSLGISNRDAAAVLTADERRTLEEPEAYLGAAEGFRRRLMQERDD